MDTRPVDRPPSTLRIKIYNRNTKTNNLFRIRHPAAGIIYSYLYPVNYTQTKKTMIEKLLLTFGIATALSLSAPDAAAAPKGGDLTGDAFLKEVPASKLYEKFRTPDSSSKLFARWWWNGTRVCEKEIVRELDSMQRAGFGGVEINSIAFPDRYKDTLGFAQVPWLSDRWLELVDFTMREAAARGMYSDLIVGSGWPFGAETLSRDEQIKMMALGTMEFEGPCKVTVRTDDLIRSATPKLLSANRDKLSELIEVRLFPAHITELIPGTPVTFAPGAQEVTIDVPAGRHIAYVVVKHTGYMGVIHGALGARGPGLDHFNAEAVRRYLNRMSDAMRPVVGNLHDRIRSIIPAEVSLPSPGQGALGVEIRSNNAVMHEALAFLNDPHTRACCTAERAVSRALGGSCQVPLAAYGIIEGEELYLRALVGNHKTGEAIRSEARGPWTEPEALAARVVEDLRRQGADAILKAVLG